MDFKLEVSDKVLIIGMYGEIDHFSAAEIRLSVIDAYTTYKCIDIVFDFVGVTFMDSAGVGMIIGRYKQACIRGGNIYAVNVNPAIERIFELSGLNKIVKKCSTVDEVTNSNKRKVI
jgi:stage II sporulation protein AA (anti-sigma F factor antagonist)